MRFYDLLKHSNAFTLIYDSAKDGDFLVQSEKMNICIYRGPTVDKENTLWCLDWILYFRFTFSTSVVQYYNRRLYMGHIIRQAESLSGKNQVLKVMKEPDVLKKWVLLTGMHAFSISLEKDVNHWRNVAFARYYGIKGIYREDAADK